MREHLAGRKPLVITIAAVLAVLTAVLVYAIMVTPQRQPYRDALVQYTHVNTALSQTNLAVNASTADEEAFTKNIDAVKAAFASLQKENEALANEPVLTEGEGKALYDTYAEDLAAYSSYNANVLESMQKVRPIFQKCSTAMEEVTANPAGATVLTACAKDMETAMDVPDGDYRELAVVFADAYSRLAYTFTQMEAVGDETSAEYQALVKQRDAIMEDFSEAGDTFARNVQTQRKALLSTRSAHDLKTYLEEKSRVF